MKFTLHWLKEFVEPRISPQKLAERLTMAGLEVESLVPLDTGYGAQHSGERDWLLEVNVTPNRGDCLSILGLAREVAVLTGARLKGQPVEVHANDSSVRKIVDVKIVNPRLCPRYSARVVHGVRVERSPEWMRSRLEACGVRPVNNVVDVTNYVMLERGQPLHAFDLDRLRSKRIVVRQAGQARKFVTLDGIERALLAEDLLICDGEEPVALAGVMGGMDTEVRPETRSVLLESANFDPVTIRRTAKRLGLHSEASHRFERGVDPQGTLAALDRAVFLLREVASAAPVPGAVDRYPRRWRPPTVWLRYERVRALLGIEVGAGEAQKIARALGLKIKRRTRRGLQVVPPSFRPDLTREADLIEELARVHGYDRIPATLPLVRTRGGKLDALLRWERAARAYLIGEGLSELIHLPFTSSQMNRRFHGLWPQTRMPVLVLNPLTQDSSEMRLSLVPGLVESLRAHREQKAKGFCGFALSKVFSLDAGGSPDERQALAGIAQGYRESKGLRVKEPSPWTFLEVKGLVEGMLELVGLAGKAVWTRENVPASLHPGKAATVEIAGACAGYLGEAHPELCEELGLPSFFIFELDFEKLVQYAPREFAVRPLPKYPSVERDLSVVLDDGFPAQQIVSWIKEQFNHSLIEAVQVFDQYKGAPVPPGKKSLAYTISYRAQDRTLTDAEVNAVHGELVSRIGEVFGAQLRE